MKTSLTRSGWFVSSVLVLLLLWEILSFQLPRTGDREQWNQLAALHALLLGVTVVAAFLGSLFGFWFLDGQLSIKPWRLLGLGAAFTVAWFFVAPALIGVGAFMGAAIGALLLSAVLAYIGGRIVGRRAA